MNPFQARDTCAYLDGKSTARDILPPAEVNGIKPDDDAQMAQFGITHSEWCEKYVVLNGRPFSLKQRPYLRPIYDRLQARHKRTIIKAGRQVEKSTTLANKILLNSCRRPNFKAIYVAPRGMQSRQFSIDRIKPVIRYSPFIATFIDKSCVDQVFDKTFNNGSSLYFRSAFLNPDSCRGLSGDLLNIDEIQDILPENIPVIEECLSHSTYKFFLYSGTPKTTDNTMEHYWKLSTQREWLITCRHMGCRYINYLDEESIGTTSLICKKCGKTIYRQDGKWYIFNNKATWEGYRISQLIVPWVKIYDPTGGEESVIDKRNRYSPARFQNEVLGLPYDLGQKPIVEAEVIACCNLKHPETGNPCPNTVSPEPWVSKYPCFAGIDWGTGSGENPAYTVLTIGAWLDPGKFCPFYIKRFIGREANLAIQPELISKICAKYNVQLIGSDWGFGAAQNAILRETWRIERVMEFQYVGDQRVPIKFDKSTLRYTVNRTSIMTEFFRKIQRQEYRFFRWEEFENFGKDILAINVEYNDTRQVIHYTHSSQNPDDAAHSIIYADLAAMYYIGRYR